MAMTVPVTGQGGGSGGEQCFEGSDNPEVGSRIQWTTTDAGVVVRVTFSKNFVDNTYGANSIGWSPNRGHLFKDLIRSDHVELQLNDGEGDVALQFKVDYMTESSASPSGYETLGVSGGDGEMKTGDESDILSARTSLDENFNTYGYVLTEDSPATDEDYTPNPQYPNWIFDVWYEVTVDPAAFGSSGFGGATMESVHASPSKTESTEPVTPVPCPPEENPCPDGEVMGDDGECAPVPCPDGQEMGDDGQCAPASCPDGEVMGDDGECGPAPCPDGEVMGDDGECAPVPCPDGQEMGDDGECAPVPCPDGQEMGDDGECAPASCPDGEAMGDDGECGPEVVCPSDLTATPQDDGSIRLDFEAALDSDGSIVYRAVDDDDFEVAAELDAGVDTWLDSTAEPGNAYRYTVTAMFGDDESEDCPVAEATSIPDFPTVLGTGGAIGGSILAYAFARRKK